MNDSQRAKIDELAIEYANEAWASAWDAARDAAWAAARTAAWAAAWAAQENKLREMIIAGIETGDVF